MKEMGEKNDGQWNGIKLKNLSDYSQAKIQKLQNQIRASAGNVLFPSRGHPALNNSIEVYAIGSAAESKNQIASAILVIALPLIKVQIV